MASADEDLSFLLRLLTFQVSFALPKPDHATSFSKAYKRFYQVPDVSESLQALEAARREMVNQLRMSDQDNGGVISSVNQFLPYAFQLMNSVLQASEGVRLEAKLEFKWESGLSTRGGRRMAENADPALMFDLGMAVAAK
ncbi:unnamed protein product, partial [Heterosigma akashiwo]